MNFEEFRVYLKELLEVESYINKNIKFYREVIKYKQNIDFYTNFEFLSACTYILEQIDKNQILNLLLNLPYGNGTKKKETKYRSDIIMSQEDYNEIKRSDALIKETIEDFYQNSLKYFLERIRFEEQLREDYFLLLFDSKVYEGIRNDDKTFTIFEYSLSIEYNNDTQQIQEHKYKKHNNCPIQFKSSYKSMEKWQKEFHPEMFL